MLIKMVQLGNNLHTAKLIFENLMILDGLWTYNNSSKYNYRNLKKRNSIFNNFRMRNNCWKLLLEEFMYQTQI